MFIAAVFPMAKTGNNPNVFYIYIRSRRVIRSGRREIAWGGRAEGDQGRDYQGHKKTLGMMELFPVLIAVTFSWLCTYVRPGYTCILNSCSSSHPVMPQ